MFSGTHINYGFLKLFKTFHLVENVNETDILVVPASINGHTKTPTLKLFRCLLGRKTKIVSTRWIKDSVRFGQVQDMETYHIKSVGNYGQIKRAEDYKQFEYQMKGKTWINIKEEEVRQMIETIGGVATINAGPAAVIVCADDEIYTSECCVGKEWLFQCIVEGQVVPAARHETTHVSDSEEEMSTVLETFPFSKKIRVQTSKDFSRTNRTQKFQACVYCGQLDKKISRHLMNQHGEEHEVAKVCNMKKGSAERRKAWIRLAAKGNFAHNNKVKQQGFGIIIPKYRTSQVKEEKRYLPCEYCTAYIIDRDLWKHHKTCVAKPEAAKSDGPVRNARLLLPKQCSDQLFRDVISKLRDDAVAAKIKCDPLILEFGQRRYDKTGKYQHTHTHISQRLRELGRFLIRANKLDPSLKQLSDCINPEKWTTVMKAVKMEAGFDESTQVYESPSFAIKCGHSLKKCAKILRNLANERGDTSTREMCIKFLENYEDEFGERVDAPARDCMNTKQYNCPKLLPLVEDVVKLSNFITGEIEKVKAQIKDGKGREQYSRLCKLILTQVILFNRRRSGEAARISKESFNKGLKSPDVDNAVKESLTKFEQKLCESHTRVEIRGKQGRKVAVLFTSEMKTNMELLIKKQQEIEGWNPEKIFVPVNCQNPYRGSKVLKEISKEANLKDANRITSTRLRKQLATMCQVLNLSEASQDILAKFMGHDIRIHRDYYRLPQGALEVAKVSKVLHMINNGKLAEVANKDLDEINVHERVELEQDSDSDEENDTEGFVKTYLKGLRNTSANDDDVEDKDWEPPNKRSRRQEASDTSEDDSDDDYDYKALPETKKKKQREYMSESERRVVQRVFEKNINLFKVPGKLEIMNIQKEEPLLSKYDWTKLKYCVHNMIQAKRRCLKRQ
ncbi:uncharacterized protein LOC123538701 [Mercenaria mercenaria]|uniref:uncharacterized protein LOC123538701 n=1 Tax=Mercenaria mercenaria TaxID=6596 RepID=UPI00234F5108|nr:uncharacterized protein LOC123538701 [Mercenaria mercenaria]